MQLNMELNLIFHLFIIIIVRDDFSVNLENDLDYMTDMLQYNTFFTQKWSVKTTEIAFSFLAAYIVHH